MVTATTREQLHRVNDPHGQLALLTITHASFGTLRLVNDTRNWTIGGNLFTACPFRTKLPQQAPGQPMRAALEMDNIGRELVDGLEQLPPGAALQATLQLVSRATPTVVDWELTSPLSSVNANVNALSAYLGNDDAMRAPAVKMRFDPTLTPGLFST
jgi:hypothetical protein